MATTTTVRTGHANRRHHAHGADHAELHGIAGKADSDLFQLHLNNLIAVSMGAAVAANVTMQIHTIDAADICRVHVRPSGFPVEAKVTIDKAGQMVRKTVFYVRASNATLTLANDEKTRYILTRWPTI